MPSLPPKIAKLLSFDMQTAQILLFRDEIVRFFCKLLKSQYFIDLLFTDIKTLSFYKAKLKIHYLYLAINLLFYALYKSQT